MINVALKEWTVAVRAMEQGLQDVIFRKGGIQEPHGDFQLAHREFLLYPAREHQKPEFIKAEFRHLLQEAQAQQKGHIVSIRSQARVVSVSPIYKLEDAHPFNGRHIWNDEFIQMRLDYKPDRPLYVLELKINPLPAPVEFVETTEYAGCRSWVELEEQHMPR